VLGCAAGVSAQDAPKSKESAAVSPSRQLERRTTKRPQLTQASDVAAFLDWAGSSRADEAEAARATIVRAGRNPQLVSRLVDEVEKTQFSDFTRSLLALGMLGELKSPAAEKFLADFVQRPLPQKGTEVDGEILEQTYAAMLQGKAADGLAYLNTERSNSVIFELVASHPSRVVRAEAINAYLWNHGDSEEAKRTLAQFIAPEELIFLDRVRHVPGESGDAFNAKLAEFLKAHPEVTPPEPERGDPASQQPNDRPNFDKQPPGF
jgi:hypothetical protein